MLRSMIGFVGLGLVLLGTHAAPAAHADSVTPVSFTVEAGPLILNQDQSVQDLRGTNLEWEVTDRTTGLIRTLSLY